MVVIAEWLASRAQDGGGPRQFSLYRLVGSAEVMAAQMRCTYLGSVGCHVVSDAH